MSSHNTLEADRDPGGRLALYLAALVLTAVLWGSSFPAIKVVVNTVGGYNYVWTRSLVAVASLAPYIAYRASRGGLDKLAIRGGLIAGVAYALGLWFQGVGTGITTASNSAFITGLNVVIVHAYTALMLRRYSWHLALSVVLSTTGLYLLTRPSGGPNIGDVLVLIGAFFWAVQVIIVSKYSSSDPLQFTFFEMAPSLLFVIPAYVLEGFKVLRDPLALILLVYLGLVCSVAAFALQVYGQRGVSPATAAIVFLLEPPTAAILAYILLDESFTTVQALGSVFILVSMYLATVYEARGKQRVSPAPGRGPLSMRLPEGTTG